MAIVMQSVTSMHDAFLLSTHQSACYRLVQTVGYTKRIAADFLTPGLVREIARSANSEYFYIVRGAPSLLGKLPSVSGEPNKIKVWEGRIEVALYHTESCIQNPDLFADKVADYDTSIFCYGEEKLYTDNKYPVCHSFSEGLAQNSFRFFVVNKDVNSLERDFVVPLWHRFDPFVNESGTVRLLSKVMSSNEQQAKFNEKLQPYDIIFLSYDEENADAKWASFSAKFPRAKRVHGVTGIAAAHFAAAKASTTSMFFVVDADAEINPDFDFSYTASKDEQDKVLVWRSINPVNGLSYGSGAVKLFSKSLVESFASSAVVDFATSFAGKFVSKDSISNITRFNTSSFAAWRAGFREACKLASSAIYNTDPATADRLEVWCSVGRERPYGTDTIAGAQAGKRYGETFANDKASLMNINNFEWLKQQYDDFVNSRTR